MMLALVHSSVNHTSWILVSQVVVRDQNLEAWQGYLRHLCWRPMFRRNPSSKDFYYLGVRTSPGVTHNHEI